MKKTLIFLIIACFFVQNAGVSYRSDTAIAKPDALRSMALRICPHSKTILPEIKWVKVKAKNNRASWQERGEFITFEKGSQGMNTVIKKVTYKGKNYMAKIACNAMDEEQYIIGQAKILNYLNILGIPGICKAKHFLQVELSEQIRDQIKEKRGKATPEKEVKIILLEEFPKGETLHNLVNDGEISEDGIVESILKIARILKSLHDNNISHGDIRLYNIWITAKEKDVILFDFDYTSQIINHKEIDSSWLVTELCKAITGECSWVPLAKEDRYRIPKILRAAIHILDRIYADHTITISKLIAHLESYLNNKKSSVAASKIKKTPFIDNRIFNTAA